MENRKIPKILEYLNITLEEAIRIDYDAANVVGESIMANDGGHEVVKAAIARWSEEYKEKPGHMLYVGMTLATTIDVMMKMVKEEVMKFAADTLRATLRKDLAKRLGTEEMMKP